MRWEEFLDKENGTTDALHGPMMSDTDRNIMRGLQHEACENCYFCEEHMCPQPVGSNPLNQYEFEDYQDEDREVPCHTKCLEEAYEAHLEARAEAQADARAADDSLWRWAW